MRVLVFGGAGMLGHKLVQRWKSEFEVFTTVRGAYSDYEKFGLLVPERTIEHADVVNFEAVSKIVEKLRPAVIVNAIGVVKQIPTSKDIVKTLQINSVFPHQVADLASRIGARFITISTDCVFDGKKGNYNEEDDPNATDIYGRSKLIGEVTYGNCLTLRTSIIGREILTGHSLVEWFLSNRGKKVKGFSEAVYSGFPTVIIAEILGNLIKAHTELNGLYHLSSDPISKFDLLRLVNKHFDAKVEIEPSRDLRIDRSLDSARFRKVTGFRPDSWSDMVQKMAADKTPYDDWR